MDNQGHIQGDVSAVPYGVGDAVGVESAHWFVAIVNYNAEKSVAEKLIKLGERVYLPTQLETRLWKNGRKVKVERVVIPMTVFIHCTEKRRKELVTLPFIKRFMIDNAGHTPGRTQKPLARIPDRQISLLRFMLGQSDIPVAFTTSNFVANDKVKVVRGSLRGLSGQVVEANDNTATIWVKLDLLGGALVKVYATEVELEK